MPKTWVVVAESSRAKIFELDNRKTPLKEVEGFGEELEIAEEVEGFDEELEAAEELEIAEEVEALGEELETEKHDDGEVGLTSLQRLT